MRRVDLLLTEIRAELRYHVYSRSVFMMASVLFLGSLIAFISSLSHARATHHFFVDEVSSYEQHGVSLKQALEAPVSVTTGADGSQVIDNPLKYDYLEVGRALHAVDGFVPILGTVLDLVTFIVIPITFIFLGAFCATFDRHARTLSVRASRNEWRTVTTAKLASLAVMAGAAVVACAVCALALAPVAHLATGSLEREVTYQVIAPTSVSSVVTKLTMTFLVAVFFGILGYAIGSATNSISWPILLAGAALFLLPFLGQWDPRNLIAAVSLNVFDFWGQFKMRPPVPVSAGAAGLALALYAALGLVIAMVLPRKSRRFS